MARLQSSKTLAALVPDMPWRACAELHLQGAEERAALGKHNLFWRPNWVRFGVCVCPPSASIHSHPHVCIYIKIKQVFYLDRFPDPGAPDPPTTDDANDRRPLPFTTLDATAMLLRLHVRACLYERVDVTLM